MQAQWSGQFVFGYSLAIWGGLIGLSGCTSLQHLHQKEAPPVEAVVVVDGYVQAPQQVVIPGTGLKLRDALVRAGGVNTIELQSNVQLSPATDSDSQQVQPGLLIQELQTLTADLDTVLESDVPTYRVFFTRHIVIREKESSFFEALQNETLGVTLNKMDAIVGSANELTLDEPIPQNQLAQIQPLVKELLQKLSEFQKAYPVRKEVSSIPVVRAGQRDELMICVQRGQLNNTVRIYYEYALVLQDVAGEVPLQDGDRVSAIMASQTHLSAPASGAPAAVYGFTEQGSSLQSANLTIEGASGASLFAHVRNTQIRSTLNKDVFSVMLERPARSGLGREFYVLSRNTVLAGDGNTPYGVVSPAGAKVYHLPVGLTPLVRENLVREILTNPSAGANVTTQIATRPSLPNTPLENHRSFFSPYTQAMQGMFRQFGLPTAPSTANESRVP